MKEERNFVILDTRTKRLLYGIKGKTLTFSTESIAFEVGIQFFESDKDFMILDKRVLK